MVLVLAKVCYLNRPSSEDFWVYGCCSDDFSPVGNWQHWTTIFLEEAQFVSWCNWCTAQVQPRDLESRRHPENASPTDIPLVSTCQRGKTRLFLHFFITVYRCWANDAQMSNQISIATSLGSSCLVSPAPWDWENAKHLGRMCHTLDTDGKTLARGCWKPNATPKNTEGRDRKVWLHAYHRNFLQRVNLMR